MCSPTSFSDHRISASRKIYAPQKDFFDSIGQSLPKRHLGVTSAYPSISGMTSWRGERRFGPIPDKEVANAINGLLTA
jgi:hypothetical protein